MQTTTSDVFVSSNEIYFFYTMTFFLGKGKKRRHAYTQFIIQLMEGDEYE